jgi:hypothetical protein
MLFSQRNHKRQVPAVVIGDIDAKHGLYNVQCGPAIQFEHFGAVNVRDRHKRTYWHAAV